MAENKANRNAGQESEQFRMWFRHTGMSEPDDTWKYTTVKPYNVEQIYSEVGNHTITHLLLIGSLPDVSKFAPQLTHLCIQARFQARIQAVSQSLSKLNKMEILDISYNDFSFDDLTDVFVAMISLRELNISECKLPCLPVSVSMLDKLEVLGISGNDFSSDGLKDAFVAMTSLRELSISQCRLTFLPARCKVKYESSV